MKKALIIIFSIGFILTLGFGTMTVFEGKKIAQRSTDTVQYEKDFSKDDDQIKKIKVNGDMTDVKIEKGSHFKVEANGNGVAKSKINSTIRNGELVIDESHNQPVINFNVIGVNQSVLTITVPDKELEKIDVNNESNDIKIHGIHAKELNAVTSSGQIDIEDAAIGTMKLKSDTGDVEIAKTSFDESTIESTTGDILFKSILGDANINARTDTGDIELNYTKAPQNTKIIHNQSDEADDLEINQPQLKAKQYGNEQYSVQLSSHTGAMEIN